MTDATELPGTVDVVVVGGGIIGLATAFELTRRGRSVLVVEREAAGGGATRVAAGMLAAVAEAEPALPPLMHLALESADLYPQFVADVEAASGLPCHHEVTGTLLAALDRDELETLRHSAEEHRRLGLRCEEISARELGSLEPRLSGRLVGGYRLANDTQVDPRSLAQALARATQTQGGSISAPATVVGADPGPPWRLTVDRGKEPGTVEAGAVIVAAGAWSQEALPGLPTLPLRPVKGQVVRLRGEPQLAHVVRNPHVYLIPRRSGELVIGASSEEQGFDARPMAGPVLELLTEAWRLLPAVRELELMEVSVGFRPALRDHLPAIGRLGPEGLYVATGHYRNGILLAPATAKLLADLITGRLQEPPPAFAPGRFAARPAEEIDAGPSQR